MRRRLHKLVLPLIPLWLAGCATLQSTANTHGPAARSIGHLSRVMDNSAVLSSLSANNPRWLAPEVILRQVRKPARRHQLPCST